MKVGILGAGQLARMLALAGKPLGLDFIFVDPSKDACANQLGEHLHGEYRDQSLLAQLANRSNVVTYEFENVPAEVAEYLAAHTQVHPSPRALAIAQDRLKEKDFFQSINIPTAKYAAIDHFENLESTMETFGYPAILKSRTQGYDGKGQSILQSKNDLPAAWDLLQGVPAIVEEFVSYNREISIIGVRSSPGNMMFYPISENLHCGGILRLSQCCTNDPMQKRAESYVTRLLESLDYVGVLALELFQVNGQLIANEFAPRVHNSGHWTIEGAETSQFENHLRAILNLPLGSTAPIGKTAMVNFIGGQPTLTEVLSIPKTHFHDYNKAPRKGRKVAHATIRAKNQEQLSASINGLIKLANETDNS